MRRRLSEIIGDYSMAGSRRNDAPGNIRAGQFVISSRGNVLSDEAAEELQPKSVVILVTDGDKFLAVSRFSDFDDMNMPGGRIDPGETSEQAAKRELWEETGVMADVVEIYREGSVVAFRGINPRGRIRGSEEGVAKWVDYDTLARGQYSDFF